MTIESLTPEQIQSADESFEKANVVREKMLANVHEVGLSPQGLASLCITVLCEMIAASRPNNPDGQDELAAHLAQGLIFGTKAKREFEEGKRGGKVH